MFQNILYSKQERRKEELKKKDSVKSENKFKAFIKRSSEPLLNMHGHGSNTQQNQPSQNQHQTLIIEEFEPDVFRQLIEYIHTGCVTLQPRTLLGAELFNIIYWIYPKHLFSQDYKGEVVYRYFLVSRIRIEYWGYQRYIPEIWLRPSIE